MGTDEKEVEIIVSVPNLTWDDAALVVRDLRYTLENCAKLGLLEDYSVSHRIQSGKPPTQRKGLWRSVMEALQR